MNSSHQRSKLFEQKSSKNRLKEFLIPLRAPSLKKEKKNEVKKREKKQTIGGKGDVKLMNIPQIRRNIVPESISIDARSASFSRLVEFYLWRDKFAVNNDRPEL